MCIAIVLGASLIAVGAIGNLSLFSRIGIAGGCITAAFFGFYWAVRTRKTFRIDISDIGQIWLEEYSGPKRSSSLTGVAREKVVGLLPDSTFWPQLLLLRLRGEDNQITVLPILRDCVGNDAFRALSIACRWIAARHYNAENENI